VSDLPLRSARSRRFTLGLPRGVRAVGSVGGRRVLVLRSDGGEDPVTHLWRLVDGDLERLVDARGLGAADDAELPAAERDRRERLRELAGGITDLSVDRDGRWGAFALSGRLHLVDLDRGAVTTPDLGVTVFDPRIAPDGRHVAVHHDDGVSVVTTGATPTLRRLVAEDGVVWGRAEFIAAEEMGRPRGMWWSPDGTRLAATRVDERGVRRAHLADPSQPERGPRELAYPFAGTPDAVVALAVLDVATGARTDVDLAAAGEDAHYLARVAWDVEPLLVGVQPRDQSALHVLAVDADGGCRTLRRTAGAPWVELVPGAPALLGPAHGGALLTVEDVDDPGGGRRALCRDGAPVTPEGAQVREVLAVLRPDADSGPDSGPDADPDAVATVLVAASLDDPTSVTTLEVVLPAYGGTPRVRDLHARPGLHRTTAVGDRRGRPEVLLHHHADLDRDHPWVEVELPGRDVVVVPAVPASTGVEVRVRQLVLGPDRLRAVLLLPPGVEDAAPGSLPVVLDPYGGPHAQRAVAARGAHLGAQWLADHGVAVLVADGRGTPGRGPGFEHAVRGDLAGPAVADQLAALDAAAALEPRLDLTRVGVRGWSYGGTLAALLALRHPDRVRAAVVGAPVTDWALYDTHYTERYLGHPDADPEAYRRSSVVDREGHLVALGKPPASGWPELLIVHGLADDNVLAAHSLRLTEALLAAGIPFRFLPLTSATHMPGDPTVAARLLEVQTAFLLGALGVARHSGGASSAGAA
jgi:dipeptidyl-peptidase-4